MTKTEEHERDVDALLAAWASSGEAAPLADYLAANSNLPGPRGNLELADAFARAVARYSATDADAVWGLSRSLAAITADVAPTNDPCEFVAFAGVRGIAAIAAVNPPRRPAAFKRLLEAAVDRRWRVREAVAMGLQDLIAADAPIAIEELWGWLKADARLSGDSPLPDDAPLSGDDPLTLRAVIAGVAEPRLLKDPDTARAALDLHRAVAKRLAATPLEERRTDGFKALRKGLGYSISVVAAALPEPGFELLETLTGSDDPDVRWVVKENLKKARLVRVDAERVARLAKRLT